MEKKRKRSRARAPEKKAKQFEQILDTGKELFVKYGTHGFSLRALAKQLDMSQTNLYNYVESKRELWIAIRKRYYTEFLNGISNIIDNHEGKNIGLFLKLSEYYLEHASQDYKRFLMMYSILAPPSKKVGPLEQAYEPFQLMRRVFNLFQRAIDVNEFKQEEAVERIYYFYGLLFGAAKVEADLKLSAKITEPIRVDSKDFPALEFRKYVLKRIRKFLEEMSV